MQTVLSSELIMSPSAHTSRYNKQPLMPFLVNRPVVPTNLDDEIALDPLNLLVRQSAPSLDEALDVPVLPADQRQRSQHSLGPRANHPLGGSSVALERARLRQVPDELGAAVAQAQVGQRVLMGNGVVGYAAQR